MQAWKRLWRGRIRHWGSRRRRNGFGLLVPLLLLLLFFSIVRMSVGERLIGCLEPWTGSVWNRLTERMTGEAVGLAVEFWHPLLQVPKTSRGIAEERDPSYYRYIERTEQKKEYERLTKLLQENSRLFQGEFEMDMSEEGQVPENEGLGTPAGSALLGNGSSDQTGIRYMAEQLADYDFLMKHFYTVHPTAAAGRDLIRAADFLEMDFSLSVEAAEGPQILIYHTHSQEEYADYHQGNSEATIRNVGTCLAEALEEKGYRVLHDTSVYDLRDGTLDRSQAYTYALEGVASMLQKYPSIQVVLDLHRDGVKEGTHLLTEINGKPTATVMFFNGTSETPDGPIAYLPNPYRKENLGFSFQMKLCADAMYPGFTRNIYLKGLRYNQHLKPRSALIEVGAQTNTYEEAKNAMEPLAELLDTVLKKRQPAVAGE